MDNATMTGQYNEKEGWARLDDLVSPERARSISMACSTVLDGPPELLHQNDKPHGGTRRLFDVVNRIEEASDIPAMVDPVIATILDRPYRLTESTFRCPQPGFGGQSLHTDTMAAAAADAPPDTATVVVALVPFNETNGATRLVPGSHNRPDLRRNPGSLDHHPDQIRLVGPAGTGFVFSGHVLHAGTRNDSHQPRPALQLVFRIDGPRWPNR